MGAITARIDRAVRKGRRTEDDEVGVLLTTLVCDDQRAHAFTLLLDHIEDIHGTGANGAADEILDLLVTYAEAAADEAGLRAGDAEEIKSGTWGPLSVLGAGGAVSIAAQVVGGEDSAAFVLAILAVGLVGLAVAAWLLRRLSHRTTARVERVRIGMTALVKAIERRRRQNKMLPNSNMTLHRARLTFTER